VPCSVLTLSKHFVNSKNILLIKINVLNAEIFYTIMSSRYEYQYLYSFKFLITGALFNAGLKAEQIHIEKRYTFPSGAKSFVIILHFPHIVPFKLME
jgi:hypothetical protein